MRGGIFTSELLKSDRNLFVLGAKKTKKEYNPKQFNIIHLGMVWAKFSQVSDNQ
jgi:hypothetical protein